MLLPVTALLPEVTKSVVSKFGQNRLYSSLKMSKVAKWEEEKAKILLLPIEEKRKLYKASDYLTINQVDSWSLYYSKNEGIKDKKHTNEDLTEFRKIKIDPEKNKELIEKVSIFKGDITKLEVSY